MPTKVDELAGALRVGSSSARSDGKEAIIAPSVSLGHASHPFHHGHLPCPCERRVHAAEDLETMSLATGTRFGPNEFTR